jgi:hypothetical protein
MSKIKLEEGTKHRVDEDFLMSKKKEEYLPAGIPSEGMFNDSIRHITTVFGTDR